MPHVSREAQRGVAPFANHLPVKIRFGEGVVYEMGELIGSEGASRAVVILEEGSEARSGLVATALAQLATEGLMVSRHVKRLGEPGFGAVDVASAAVAAAEADIVVAIGGGSVIDTAKAARLCAQTGMSFADWLSSGRPFPVPALPLIAVPTTAGTGSEVSGGSVITDERTALKIGIADPTLRPSHALVDPLLTETVPAPMTAYTGVDALAQAIAGMVATTRTPIGDALALESIRLAGRSLVRAYRDGGDAEARSDMACASLLAGLTMNVSDCAAEHSLAQAIGGMFAAAHGLTVGLVLAETLERERRHVPAVLERVADALEVRDDGSGDGSRALRGIRGILRDLEFPVLASLGVQATDIEELTRRACDDFFIGRSPSPWTVEEVAAAFGAALALEVR